MTARSPSRLPIYFACALLTLAALVSICALLFAQPSPVNTPNDTQTPSPAKPPAKSQALYPRWRKTIEVYKLRTENDPRNHLDLRTLGEAYMALARATGEHSHFAPAEEALRKSLDLMPRQNAGARVSLAGCLSAQHRFKEALAFIAESQMVEADEKMFIALRGDAQLALGEYDLAESAYNEYSRQVQAPHAWTRVAHIAELRGNKKRARALMLQAKAELGEWEQESQAWIRVQIGLLDLGEGKLAAAKANFEDSLNWAPEYFLALQFLARCAEISGDYKEARRLLLIAASVSRPPEVLMPLARAEKNLGNNGAAELLHTEALQHFETHIKAGDKSHLRAYALALIELQLKPTLALELAAQDAAARDDIHTSAALALARSANGRHKEALSALERALRLDTPDAALWLIAESVYRAADESDKANKALARARELNPLVKGQEARWLAAWR